MRLVSALKKNILFTVLSVLLSCGAVSAGFAQEVKVITFGDSITAGLKRDALGSISCPTGVSLEPSRFGSSGRMDCYGNGALNVGGYQAFMATTLAGFGYSPQIANYGFSGATTGNMLSLRSSVLSSLSGAQYVLILGGANDAFDGISRSTVLSNLAVIVNDVRSRGMTPVLATTTRIANNGVLDLRTSQYSDDIRQYAANNNVLLADARAVMGPNWSSFHGGDFLHLGALGDQTLSDVYLQSMGLATIGAQRRAGSIVGAIMLLLDDAP